MQTDHVETIGLLAQTMILRAIEPGAPLDLALIASDVAMDQAGLFRPVPAPDTILQAMQLAGIMANLLNRVIEAREAAEADGDGYPPPYVDDTGPGVVPRRRGPPRYRTRRVRWWPDTTVAGEDGDTIVVRGAAFEDGAALIALGAIANRAGIRPACFLDPRAAREVAAALIERADALDPAGASKARRRKPGAEP